MIVVADAWHSTDVPRGGVATIGNYDGVHRGQRATIDQVVLRARELGVPSLVVTFDPHPVTVLDPGNGPARLTLPKQKERLLAATGLDALLVIRFSEEFARTPAERFVTEFLHRNLEIRHLVVGARFSFGHGRTGDVAMMERMGSELGFTVEGVDEKQHRGAPISSSRIREAVSEGRMELASELLGRPYLVSGVVVRGDRMGQRLGWPTVNVDPDHELIPADGVYATRVRFSSFSTEFDSATNIGTRPTVYENYQRVLESHVLDFSTDVYGERVEVTFYRRLREERLFPSVMDLSVQIRRDVDDTREYFAAMRRLQEEEELSTGSSVPTHPS